MKHYLQLKVENHTNNTKTWENNYGIKFEKKTINKSLKATLKMEIEPRIKERMIRHINQTFMKINPLYKPNIKKKDSVKNAKKK